MSISQSLTIRQHQLFSIARLAGFRGWCYALFQSKKEKLQLIWFFAHLSVPLQHDDINHRFVDTATGHDAWFGLRVFYEGRDVGKAAEDVARFCVGCHGGGIGMVAVDSSDGDVLNGKWTMDNG